MIELDFMGLWDFRVSLALAELNALWALPSLPTSAVGWQREKVVDKSRFKVIKVELTRREMLRQCS